MFKRKEVDLNLYNKYFIQIIKGNNNINKLKSGFLKRK